MWRLLALLGSAHAFMINTPELAGRLQRQHGTGDAALHRATYGAVVGKSNILTGLDQPLNSNTARSQVRKAVRMAAATAEQKKVAIIGPTGAVGKEIIDVLAKRKFPVESLVLFGSARSAGKEVETPFGTLTIQEFSVDAAREVDVCFMAVSGDFALEYAPAIAAEGGPIVIDNSSAFRYDADTPLIVPEVNAKAAEGGKKRLIANPNCTTAIALMALAPLHAEFGIKKCIMSTYQAASGAGAPGMNELQAGVEDFVGGKEIKNDVFAHPLPFNVIPHIDKFQDNLYTKEEMKVTWETRKIMDLPDLPVSCTCVRIPTMRAHAESITIETEKPISPDAARAALATAPGVKVVDNPDNNEYPMPLTATGEYDVEVGRVRQSEVFGETGLDFFVVGDQLLRGAALNAVLIAEAINEE